MFFKSSFLQISFVIRFLIAYHHTLHMYCASQDAKVVTQAERGSWQHLLWYKAIRVLIYLVFLWLKSRFIIEIVIIIYHETKRPQKHHMSQQRERSESKRI